jgi:hypothetical protein
VPPLGAPPEAAPPTAPAAPVAEGLKDAWRAAPPQPVAPPEPLRQEPSRPQPVVAPPSAPQANVAAKPAAALAKPKPVEFKLPETKPEPVKKAEPKVLEPKAGEPKRSEPKPIETKSLGTKPPESKPVETKPAEIKPIVFKPAQPPSELWFLRGEDGETFGPVDRPTLDAWYAEGRMTADSQLLKQGNEQWQWASDLYPDLDEPEDPAPTTAPVPVSAGSSIHRDELASPSASQSAGRSGKSGASQSRRLAAADDPDGDPETGERLSPHSKPVAFLLALTLGMFGIHRFYLGYVGIGLAMFFTFGGLLMWSLTDALRILFGHVTDSEGLKLRD